MALNEKPATGAGLSVVLLSGEDRTKDSRAPRQTQADQRWSTARDYERQSIGLARCGLRLRGADRLQTLAIASALAIAARDAAHMAGGRSMSHYPQHPGCRAGSPQTSLLAALDAAQTAPRAIDRILAKLAGGPASPEELHAAFLAEGDPLLLTSIRARVTQLKRLGRVIDSGERGVGESLKSKVRKMRLTTPAEMSEALAAQRAREEAEKGARA